MKRILSLLILLALIFALPVYSSGESLPAVYSYDFSLRFHLNADAFPVRLRSHMQGYADLFDLIEIRGNIAWCPDYQSMDLNAEIIPVTNPDASISFRLFGVPENMCLTSPLLGHETIWFANYVLMEFALKTWNNLHIPLQYPVLLYPYATENAFSRLASVWSAEIGRPAKSTSVSYNTLRSVSGQWNELLQTDSRLIYWISGVSAPSFCQAVLEEEFFRLPDFLLNQVALNDRLTVSVQGSTETWTNKNREILFTRTSDGLSDSWTLSLPATAGGYVPYMTCTSESENGLFFLSASGSYQIPGGENLLSFTARLDSFPLSFPADAAFSASCSVSGSLLPGFDLTIHAESSQNGDFRLTLSQPVDQSAEPVVIFTGAGRFVPVEASSVPFFTQEELTSYISVFSVNDQTMSDFVHKIGRPLFFGILNFLNEVPARACQSVMDDLEDYGVLDMVLGQ